MPKHFFMRRRRPVHVCPWCRSDLASLVASEFADATHWRVLLRCGECGVWREETIGLPAMDALVRELDRATEAITAALSRMDQERMAEEVNTFAVALERDLIDPAAFER